MPDHELIAAWLEKASHDLETAKVVSMHLPEFHDTIAFHCQQAIEKNLKAYLIFLDIEFKPVHDLGYLLNLIGTKVDVLDPYYNQVDKISRYAVQVRYPDAIIKLTRPQIEEATNLTVQVADLIKKMIGVNH